MQPDQKAMMAEMLAKGGPPGGPGGPGGPPPGGMPPPGAGGPPPGGMPPPGAGGPPPSAGPGTMPGQPMDPQQAMQMLQALGVTEDTLPMLKSAVDALMPSGAPGQPPMQAPC